VQQAIEGLTGFKAWSEDLPDYLSKLAEAELPWSLPFPWKALRTIAVRPAVIPALLNPGPNSELVKAVEEVDNCPVLVMDGMLVGKQALWLVYNFPGHGDPGGEAQRWISKQVSPMLIIGTYRNSATYIGAPLWSFVK